MRIFMGFTEVCGYYTNLKRGLESLGLECTFIVWEDDPFKQDKGRSLNALAELAKYFAKKRQHTPRRKLFQKIWWKCLHQVIKSCLFVWALVRHDVFIFGFNSSFFSYKDLPILKLMGKKIIYVFHGSDARPPYLSGAYILATGGVTVEQCVELTEIIKKNITVIERYADAIVSHPPIGHFHERAFVSFTLIGIPCDIRGSDLQSGNLSDEGSIRILHAPSRPASKGTFIIREAIERLRYRGYSIEFIEILNSPNTVVLSELAICDFVVDQLYSDTFMAGLATEAAFFGKPSIVGGYAAEEVRRSTPSDKIPPTHYCHPDDIEESIEKLISDKGYRIELGRKAKQFVETNWTPNMVAKRFLQLIQDKIPKDWLQDPNDIHYLHGYGLPEDRVKQSVRAVIEKYGKDALQLSDKPELEHMLIEFAYSEVTQPVRQKDRGRPYLQSVTL